MAQVMVASMWLQGQRSQVLVETCGVRSLVTWPHVPRKVTGLDDSAPGFQRPSGLESPQPALEMSLLPRTHPVPVSTVCFF